MHPDAVVNPLGRRLTLRGIWGDDEDFVTGATEMLDHPKHRVRDAVDIREERLCDDRNAHTKIMPATAVRKVACGDTTRKYPVRHRRAAVAFQAFVQALRASQARFGEGPSDDEIADLARESDLSVVQTHGIRLTPTI
jgi:hypothetical protein